MEREIAQVRQAGARANRPQKEIDDQVKAIEKAYADKTRKPRKPKQDFSDDKYLAGLEKRAVDVWTQVDVIEREALRQNDELFKTTEISAATHERAKLLIMQAAAKERLELQDGLDRLIAERLEKSNQKELDAQAKMDKRRSQAREAISSVDPIQAIRFQEEEKVALYEQYRQVDLANTQLYEDAKAAIRKKADADVADHQAKVMSQQMSAYGQLFGGIAGMTKAFAGEQSSAYKAMFAVSKAFAVADAIVKIQQGIAGAASLPWPANLAAMASVAASTAGIVSTIQGTNYGGGRQYGGPVTAGSLYRVNETGKPEMYTAANGSQYMLPTANGNVTPANQVGAGGMPNITVVFNTSTQLQEQSRSWNEQTQTVEIAVSEVASQIANNTGKVWSAMRNSTNIQPRM